MICTGSPKLTRKPFRFNETKLVLQVPSGGSRIQHLVVLARLVVSWEGVSESSSVASGNICSSAVRGSVFGESRDHLYSYESDT